jgi:acyl-CoA synthetase (AMP-forming)/AMP-acid ligase II
VEPLTVGDIIRVSAGRRPGGIAASMDDRLMSYAEADEATSQNVRAFFQRGVRYGHRVVWWGETTLDAIPMWFALAELGAVVVPMNPRFTADEAKAQLDQADPFLVVTDDQHAGGVSLSELKADRTSTGVDLVPIDETDPHVIFFTSGSSGQPKGVEISHRASRLRTIGDSTQWPVGPTICMFPQFHMAGWYNPMTTLGSAEEVAFAKPEAETLLQAVHERRAIRLYCIPAVWRRILEADRSGYDLSCLRFCDTGTSATSPELLTEIAEAFPGTQTSITYGSTEAGGVCRLWPADVHRKHGSVGPAAPGCKLRLSDTGELLVKNPFLLNGYFRNEEATAEAMVDGYFRTGDLAVCDDEGFYSITGRAKEVLRTGGETVAPVEVDNVLMTLPGVLDVAIAGVPDDDWGELITAFVVLRPGQSLTLATIRAHCEGQLAAYKHPRRLFFATELPRTGATRQIQRRVLVQWAQAHATGGDAPVTPA